MNRAETIEKLIKEGFSEKTLVKFNDNQLKKFAGKILKEAQTVTTTKTVYNSKDPKDIAALNAALKNPDALKNQPAEVKEASKKKASKKSPKSDDGQTDEELYNALSDMGWNYGEYGSDDFDDDGFAEAAMNLGYRWNEKKKKWYNRDTNESIKSSHGFKKINEFVNNIVDKKYHTMTTKSEMVELVKSKMKTVVSEDLTEKRMSKMPRIPEFLSFDAIMSSGKPEEAPAQPEVIPDTPTREKPTREDDPRRRPFRNPNEEPGVDPDPKAKIRKISRPNMSMAAE
jgi:hypothetical protein